MSMKTVYQTFIWLPCLGEWQPCSQCEPTQLEAIDAAERACLRGYPAAIVVADLPDPVPGADVPIVYVNGGTKCPPD